MITPSNVGEIVEIGIHETSGDDSSGGRTIDVEMMDVVVVSIFDIPSYMLTFVSLLE